MSDIKRASLADIERMRRAGSLHHDPEAPEGEDLGDDFWADAEVVLPKARPSVSLRVDEEVLDYFKGQDRKGYTARMAAVLKAYVEAKTRKRA